MVRRDKAAQVIQALMRGMQVRRGYYHHKVPAWRLLYHTHTHALHKPRHAN